MEKTKAFLHSKARSFAQFAYRKENGEIFGRTCKSWSQIASFFLLFYSVIGAVFAVHLAIFIQLTPKAGENVKPWNFGRFAYPNYPNAKIDLIPLPRAMKYNGNKAIISDGDKNQIRRLLTSANQSGVSDHCLNGATRYGYADGEPCVFLQVQRVFEWSPDLINLTLSDASLLPITCKTDSSVNHQINITSQPAGIPLNLSNNDDSRSFPYRDQTNFISPVMGVMINLTGASLPSQDEFKISIVCSLDYTALGMPKPSGSALSRLYEIPADARTVIHFEL